MVDQLSEQDREQVTEYLFKKRYMDAAAVSNAQPDQAEVQKNLEQWIEEVKTLEYEQPIERSGLKNLANSEAEMIAAKRSWLELEGIAAGSGKEENAQAWVMQTRDEWDDRECRC